MQRLSEQQARELQLLEAIFGAEEARQHAKLYAKLELRRQALQDSIETVSVCVCLLLDPGHPLPLIPKP